jgi:hypothetical protein
MDEKIKQFKEIFHKMFDAERHKLIEGQMCRNDYIEVLDNIDEVIIRANREGLLHLIEQLLILCESNFDGAHYHLDEAGMAHKCERNVVIAYRHLDWDSQ